MFSGKLLYHNIENLIGCYEISFWLQHTQPHIHTYHNQIIILLSPQETWRDALKEKQEWKNKNKRQKQNKLHWKHTLAQIYTQRMLLLMHYSLTWSYNAVFWLESAKQSHLYPLGWIYAPKLSLVLMMMMMCWSLSIQKFLEGMN